LRKSWKILKEDPELSHVHSVPCDSHGLQLAMKDILFPGKDQFNCQIESDASKSFLEGPDVVVSFFRRSDKQLAFLRNCMLLCLGKILALVATVLTRWGTQVRQIKFILDSEMPLKSYASLPDAADTVKPLLQDDSWWQRLKSLYQLVYPFHEHQKMSESNRAGLNKVYPRWIKLNSHLQQFREPGSFSWWQDVDAYCNRIGQGGWQDRIDKQLLPIHLVAYLLTPEHRETILMPALMMKAEKYVQDHCGDTAYGQWVDYLTAEGCFNLQQACWTRYKANPKLFWKSSVSITNC
jgi:hypothetical protein